MKYRFLIFILLLFFSYDSNAQLNNGGFEEWNDSIGITPANIDFIESAHKAFPLTWEREHSSVGALGMYQTTDAVEGDYGIVMFTWYVYMTSTIMQEGAITYRPDKLTGDYKYFQMATYDEVKDSASVSIILMDEIGDEIGTGLLYLDTISEYTSFDVAIDYISDAIPTSYFIEIKNAQRNCHVFDNDCNYFFLDNLRFELETSVIEEPKQPAILFYPNPSFGDMYFTEEVEMCDVMNLNGQLISTYKDVSKIELPSKTGRYILKLIDKTGQIYYEFVVKI